MRTEMARLTLARKISAVAESLEERRNVRSEETEFEDIAVSSGLPAER